MPEISSKASLRFEQVRFHYPSRPDTAALDGISSTSPKTFLIDPAYNGLGVGELSALANEDDNGRSNTLALFIESL